MVQEKQHYGPTYLPPHDFTEEQFKYGKVIPTQTSMAINSATIKHGSLDRPITIIDCPGHPRLAHLLRQSLSTTKPKGVILLIDAATLNKDLSDVSSVVYSTLLALPRPAHVLCVANKGDLFTALPVGRIRELLEKEITSLKKTKDNSLDEDERTTLGGSEFKFSELGEEGVLVEWASGSAESRQVAGIVEWISRRVSG